MWRQFKQTLLNENPVFGLYLGMCSSLAVSTTLNSAFGMGVCVLLVLIITNGLISLMRKIIPSEIRLPIFIIIIASVVSIVEMLVHAFTPKLYESLGVFLGLVVVNCIILGRAESFAFKNKFLPSIIDALAMGVGYLFSLSTIAFFREVLASGGITFNNPFAEEEILFSFSLTPLALMKIDLFQQPVGAFFIFACLAAVLTFFKNIKLNKKNKSKLCE